MCFITNASYLGYRSYTVMRERLVGAFDRIWIDAMNGDSRQTGKLTPDGRPDPSVFSTDLNPEGIRVGTAISLLVRRNSAEPKEARVGHREFWGTSKRADLLATLDMDPAAFEKSYEESKPSPENRFKLAPDTTLAVYRAWPSLAELSVSEQWSGLLEKRKGSLIAHDRATIEARVERYCDPTVPFESLRVDNVGPVAAAAGFDPQKARGRLIGSGGTSAGRFAKIMLHPFDQRWCFHTNVSTIWNRSRPEVAAQEALGTTFIVTRLQARQADEGLPVFSTRNLPGDHSLDPNAHPFPVRLHRDAMIDGGLALHGGAIDPNLSPRAREYLTDLELGEWLTPNHPQADALWFSSLAIAYAPAWLDENEEAILDDWPRVPLPNDAERLISSAALGRRIADLLDPDTPLEGVTSGTIMPPLRRIAVLEKLGGGSASAADLAMTARWGAQDSRGATMPGPGRISEREYSALEAATFVESALLGDRTRDVYLNDMVYWCNVPDEVWGFTIGGFQVLKKWLSYRTEAILGRPLSLAEINYFRDTARRLAALRLLAPELNENYHACSEGSYPWRTISLQ